MMDGLSTDTVRDRHFEPSKIAVGEPASELVSQALRLIAHRENRQRARKQRDQALHESMVSALVLDVVHRELLQPDGWLSVSLQRDRYRPKWRTAPFLTEQFPKLITSLAGSGGLIELRKGFRSAFGPGQRTTLRASDTLHQLMDETGVSLEDIGRNPSLCGDPLVLRSRKVKGKAHDLRFIETDETRSMRAEVEQINEWISAADIWWAGDEVEDRVDLGDRCLRRIFNNGDFALGGRLFGGFWQRTKSALRLNRIRFGDYTAVSLDFGQMAVRTAYSKVSAEPPKGDLYAIPGLLESHREGVKRVLNALLASDAIPTRFPAGTRRYFRGSWNFTRHVFDPIARHHHQIRSLFGTSQSLELMNLESRLLVAILLRLQGLGVVALPIHDCLLVSQKDKGLAKQVMEDSFREFLNMEGVVEESDPNGYTLSKSLGSPLRGA